MPLEAENVEITEEQRAEMLRELEELGARLEVRRALLDEIKTGIDWMREDVRETEVALLMLETFTAFVAARVIEMPEA